MGSEYDDWGNPLGPRYEQQSQHDKTTLGTAKAYSAYTLRRYRSLITTILLGICLLFYYFREESTEVKPTKVDWKDFAYVQYVTDSHNLCNSYMVFESLHRLGSKADRVLLYPKQWDTMDKSHGDRTTQLLIRMRKFYKVKTKPIRMLSIDGDSKPGNLNAPSSWDSSITKLRAFDLYEYRRVLHLDSDITLLKPLDELFLLPSTPIAMPRAYWIPSTPSQPSPLTSLLMLIEPNPLELHNFIDILMSWKLQPNFQAGQNYDMDLLNHRFGSSAMVLPHRPYALLSAEFRNTDHTAYLGTHNGPRIHFSKYSWDADSILQEAKLVHFSDWPLPKPWVMWPHEGVAEVQPKCEDVKHEGQPGVFSGTCREREVWKKLYTDFRKRRKNLCRVLSVPAPQWSAIRNATRPKDLGDFAREMSEVA